MGKSFCKTNTKNYQLMCRTEFEFYLVQQRALSSSAWQCTYKIQSYWSHCYQIALQFYDTFKCTNGIAKYTTTEYETPCNRRRNLNGRKIITLIIIIMMKVIINTGCFKKRFTTLKAYRNLYRGSYSHGFFLMEIR